MRAWSTGSSSARGVNTPMRIRSPCCALAASGHAAAPLSSVMNSRRFITRSPRRRARAAVGNFEAKRLGCLSGAAPGQYVAAVSSRNLVRFGILDHGRLGQWADDAVDVAMVTV